MTCKAQSPAVVITGLPWLRTGTGKVMEEQVAFFKSIGWTVLFVACPHTGSETFSHPVWKRFKQHSSDLGADAIAIASFKKRVRSRGLTRKLVARWKKQNAMHWRVGLSKNAILTDELGGLIRAANVQLVLVNHVYTLELAKRIKSQFLNQDVPLCVVTHDVQSHILLDNSIVNPITKRLDRVKDLELAEVQALSAADYLIHVSHADLSFFRLRLPAIRQAAILPCAPDRTSGDFNYSTEKSTDFLFVGANHVANFEAVVWLLEEVYPKFDEPKPSLRIVGNIDSLVEAQRPDLYARHRSHFIGEVSNSLDEYRSARCILVPMVGGRGVSIKTIEATSVGLPIVGTPAAFRGLPPEAVKDAGVSIYASADEFAAAAQDVLKNPESFCKASARLYHSLFSLEVFANSMSAVLHDLGISGSELRRKDICPDELDSSRNEVEAFVMPTPKMAAD